MDFLNLCIIKFLTYTDFSKIFNLKTKGYHSYDKTIKYYNDLTVTFISRFDWIEDLIDIFLITITMLIHRHGIFIIENVNLLMSPRNLILLKAEHVLSPCLDLPCFDLLIILFLRKLRRQEWRNGILNLILLNSTCQAWQSHNFISSSTESHHQSGRSGLHAPDVTPSAVGWRWLGLGERYQHPVDWGMAQGLREMVFINQYFNPITSSLESIPYSTTHKHLCVFEPHCYLTYTT